MAVACRAYVSGRVQGVNFRSFARRKALARGLTGYARNLPDGATVEVYAEGDEDALRSLLQDLREGPALSRVDAIREEWLEPTGRQEGFQVL